MRRWMSAALIVAAAIVASLGAQTQAPAKKPAVKRAAPAIAWVASYDLAIKRMGADQTPVLLYFTYDG